MSDCNLLINGKMVPGDLTMPVLNPATEEVLAQCPRASKSQLDEAVAAAKAAFPAWAATPITERRALVTKMADAIEANTNELARLLTSEQGKPLADATGEVMGMAGFFRYLSSLDLPMRVIEDSGDRRVEAHRRPLGVIGAIIPWNYPLLILSFKLPSVGRQYRDREAGADHAAVDAAVCPTGQGHPAQGRAQRHHRRQRSRRRHDQAS
jgi:acyl-CoA reductase-like NAD-dependent aldehyde dehydrogenase